MIILRITIQKKSSESFSLWHGETIEHGFGKSAAPFFLFFCTGRRHHPWQPLPNQSINQSIKKNKANNKSINHFSARLLGTKIHTETSSHRLSPSLVQLI